MNAKTTLEHIRDLALENAKSPMDGYSLIYEWANRQLSFDMAYPTPRKEV